MLQISAHTSILRTPLTTLNVNQAYIGWKSPQSKLWLTQLRLQVQKIQIQCIISTEPSYTKFSYCWPAKHYPMGNRQHTILPAIQQTCCRLPSSHFLHSWITTTHNQHWNYTGNTGRTTSHLTLTLFLAARSNEEPKSMFIYISRFLYLMMFVSTQCVHIVKNNRNNHIFMLTHQLGKGEYIIALLYYLMCLIPPQVFTVIVNMLTLILLEYNVKDKSATLEKIIDIRNFFMDGI